MERHITPIHRKGLIMKAAVICAIILALACGGSGEPQAAADGGGPEVEPGTAPAVDPVEQVSVDDRDICRQQMAIIWEAEQQYFLSEGAYCTLSELGAAGYLEDSEDCYCPDPETGVMYCITIDNTHDAGYFEIECIWGRHGSIVDGTASWEDSPAGVAAPIAEACRAQMRTMATAESMYFARFDGYSDPAGFVSSGVLPEAGSLRCPESGSSYSFTLTFDPASYRVQCDCGHGYIADGAASWE